MAKEAKKVTRERLARETWGRFPDLTLKTVSSVVDDVFDQVLDHLLKGRGVFVHGLGTLHVESWEEKTRYVPAKGEKVLIPPKKVARFRPSKELTRALNDV